MDKEPVDAADITWPDVSLDGEWKGPGIIGSASKKFYCQKCGKCIELEIANSEFRVMMLENPGRIKNLLGKWQLKGEGDIIRLYCPDCK